MEKKKIAFYLYNVFVSVIYNGNGRFIYIKIKNLRICAGLQCFKVKMAKIKLYNLPFTHTHSY